MKRSFLVPAAFGAAALSFAAGVASATTHAPGRVASVGVASTPLGRILVDGSGRTLYLFEKDRPGRSLCSGACVGY